MKSIIIKGPYALDLMDEDIPKAGQGEIVVEAELSGISSGTEMMLYRGTFTNFQLKKWTQWRDYPVYPGYELAGRVVEVGQSVKREGPSQSVKALQPGAGVIQADTDEFKIGDRVICLGAHQQYARVPATHAAKIPDSLSFERATLAILGTTTMHSTRRLRLEYGATVAVIGQGVVGNLALQHAKLAGAAKTIALDLDEKRLGYAKTVGADVTINTGKDDPVERVFSQTEIGADAVVEASGARGTLQLALDIMRDRGVVEILGWHTEEINFIFGDLYFKEGSIIATRAGGPDPGMPYAYVRWGVDQSLRLSVQLIADARVKSDFFEPSRFSYKDIKKVYGQIDKNPSSIGLQALLEWK
jgi:2-desacetyl-2-hydroxyethyl bacteriochlorophyllide A dehydrogenase